MTIFEETLAETLELEQAGGDPSLVWNIEEDITLAPDATYSWRTTAQIEQEIHLTRALEVTTSYHTTISLTFKLLETYLKIYDLVTISEDIELSEVSEELRMTYSKIRERFYLSNEELLTTLTWQVELAQTISVIEQWQTAAPVTIAENVTLADLLRPYGLYVIAETIGLTDTLAAKFSYGLSLAETVTVVEDVARYLGASIADTLAVVDLLARRKIASPEIDDTISIADAASQKLYISVTAADTVEITPEQALQMQFRPTLEDTVEIVSMYLTPDGGMTTWAVTLSHGAVTEYTNYEFNSFAQMGNKYLAASSEGIYELNGDTDAGEDIIARIRSGILAIGGSRFTAFKGVYLGVRGGGDFVLKLIDGKDKTYIYSVEAKSMETTRITVGKGLRARYFSFELISTGQDFDLDTIEFLPLVSSRRV